MTHATDITSTDLAAELHTNGKLVVGPCGYTVEFSSGSNWVRVGVRDRDTDITPTEGRIAPWVHDLVRDWFLGEGGYLFTRNGECLTGGHAISITGVRPGFRDSVSPFLAEAVTGPAAVLPRSLADRCWKTDGTPVQRILAAFAAIEPGTGPVLEPVSGLGADQALEAWARAFEQSTDFPFKIIQP